MDQPIDENDDVAAAKAREILNRQFVKQAARETVHKQVRVLMLLAVSSFALIGVIVAVLFIPRSSPKPVAPAPPPPLAAEPPPLDPLTPERIERKASLNRSWALVKDIPPEGRFKPLLDDAVTKGGEAARLWREQKYNDADHALTEFGDAIQAIELLYQAREMARTGRQSALEIAVEAERNEVATEAEPALLTGLRALLNAERAMDHEDFHAANDQYDIAGKSLAEALSTATKARAIKVAQTKLLQEITRRFDHDTLSTFGGEAWKKISATLENADRALKESRFDDASSQLSAAREMLRDLERTVELAIGGHYFALISGYRAADLLLVRAAGKSVKPDMIAPLQGSLKDLGATWPDEWTGQVQTAEIAKTATLLTETLSNTVRSAGGDRAVGSFNIGVQIRLIQRLVASDNPASLRQDIIEIRHSLGLMGKLGEDLGYPPKFAKMLQTFSEKLTIKPEFEAMLQSQAMIGDIVRRLNDFDEMMPLLPRGLKK